MNRGMKRDQWGTEKNTGLDTDTEILSLWYYVLQLLDPQFSLSGNIHSTGETVDRSRGLFFHLTTCFWFFISGKISFV